MHTTNRHRRTLLCAPAHEHFQPPAGPAVEPDMLDGTSNPGRIPSAQMVRQGLIYLANALALDTPLVIGIAVGLGSAWIGRKRTSRVCLASGGLLYLGYVVWIGGDFMAGRFLTAPLFMAACLIADCPLPLQQPRFAVALLVPFALLFFHPSAVQGYPVGDFRYSGVADERIYYSDATALMLAKRNRNVPAHALADEGREARANSERFKVTKNVGFMGYFAGPAVHLVDENALTDPFLARLPARNNPEWRVGHYERELPEGYLETLRAGGRCKMPDRNLCRYLEKLRLIVAGELWSWQRLRTIVAMNVGAFDGLIDRERYRYPGLQTLELDPLRTPIAESAGKDAVGAHGFGHDGIEIYLGKIRNVERLGISLEGNDDYEVVYRNGSRTVARVQSSSPHLPGMRTRWLTTPRAALHQGFDRLLVRPLSRDGSYAVGYLRGLD